MAGIRPELTPGMWIETFDPLIGSVPTSCLLGEAGFASETTKGEAELQAAAAQIEILSLSADFEAGTNLPASVITAPP